VVAMRVQAIDTDVRKRKSKKVSGTISDSVGEGVRGSTRFRGQLSQGRKGPIPNFDPALHPGIRCDRRR